MVQSEEKYGGQTRTLISMAVLLGLSLLIYAQVVGFGIIGGWDDHYYFVERELLDSWWSATLWERVFTPDIGYPSAIPTFLYVLLRDSQALVHGLVLLFHLLNVALVYQVGRRWLNNDAAAFSVGLLWAAHPVLAESVAWITNLKSVGAATCALAVLLLWRRYLDEPRGIYLIAAFGLFIMGLGFKPLAVMIMPLLVGLTVLERPELLRRPLFLIFTAIGGVLTLAYLQIANQMHRDLIVEIAGFQPENTGLDDTLERIGGAFFVQLRNIFAPLELHPMYFSSQMTTATVAIGWAALILLLLYSGWTFFRCRPASSGMLFFWLSYLPSSGVEFMPRFTADTYTYLPLFGLLWSAAALALSREWFASEKHQQLGRFALIAMAVVFSLLSFMQVARWENSETLWPPVLLDNPTDYVPYHMVAQSYYARGEYEKAARVWQEGVQYYSDPGGDRIMGLAMALEKAGRPDQALLHMIRILRGDFPKPERAESFTLYLLVQYELPLPEAAEDRQLLLRAAETQISNPEIVGEAAQQAAEYFIGQGEEGVARLFKGK